VGLGITKFGHLAQTGLAKQTQVHGGSQGQQTLVEQMLDVARSRLICCSRAVSVQHISTLAAAIDSLTDQRPAILWMNCLRVAKMPRYGPP